jgi:hypothetical protein
MKRPPIFIDYLKTAIPSKAINRLNTIPIEISMSLSIEIKKINPKIDMETKKTHKSQINPLPKRNIGGTTIPAFKLYCRAFPPC